MASKLQIHKPYVLQALPRPLDRQEGPGRYHASEVFGQKQGFKRRKRAELSVAVDGVAVYLYDILSSQPVTSYLVSPQSAFTCPPYSLRWRPSSSTAATRYTYVSISTKGASSSKPEIRLFREETSGSDTTVTSASRPIHCDAPIVHIFASSMRNAALPSCEAPDHDLIAVAADGTILCLHGETLEERWQSSPSVLSKDLLSGSKSGLQIDSAHSTTASDVVDGFFGGKNDLFGVFQEKVHRDGFNPDFLVLISSQDPAEAQRPRHLHILALPSESEARRVNRENIISVFVAPLPIEADGGKHQLDVRSGTLQVLSGGLLSTYAFNSGIPRLESKLQVDKLASFLRLSKTSVLTSAANSFSIYNPVYRSLQVTVPIDPEESGESNGHCEFITYLASREIAVGLRGTDLIALQVEAPKNRSSKRRAEGLLSDAIRRGISRDQSHQKRIRAEQHPPSAVLADPLPGSLVDASSLDWENKVHQAENFLGSNDLRSWEELLAGVFKVPTKPGVQQTEKATLTNGASVTAELPEWVWPPTRADYARVDRRWIFYAISRVLAWEKQEQGSNAARLACRLPETSVLNYLVDAGHLSTSNIRSAFKDEVRDVDEAENVIGAAVPPLLADVDPTMELLVGYVSGTQLGSTELVSTIKVLLRSLDLFKDSSKIHDMRLGHATDRLQDQENEVVNMELDRAEEELQITERYLDDHRARGLGVAFSKLAACPALSTVMSLRRLFKPEETIGLMNVLRAELIKDGWTTRYLDRTGADQDEIEAPPDGSIQLIADLMSRCIDSVGLGGWMASDAMLAGPGTPEDSADFFSQFQAEVSVALEGIMEAVRLQGALAEAVNYAKKARKALADSAKGKATSVQLTQELPLGLKTDSRISLERVRSGAEVVPRSSRQIGHFVSKKRGIYSVHRISEEALLGGSGVTVVQEAR